MAKTRKDAMVANGEYTDRDGNTKTSWLKIGTLFENDEGKQTMLLEAVPVGVTGPVWVKFFEPKTGRG
jgi:hypothetical protein